MNISFVLCKSRLAPLDKNALTIPKLELLATVVAVRMKVKLLEESNISINKVYFWVDSATVLRYIRNENKRFSVFVSHRVNEIRSNSNIADWHFIEGKLNVAGDCSRVIKCKDFTPNSRYLKRPEFLQEFSLKKVLQTDELLRQNEPIEIINKTSKLQQTDYQFSSIIPWERFSSFQKLVKVISAVINIAKY